MDPSQPIVHTHVERPVTSETRGLRDIAGYSAMASSAVRFGHAKPQRVPCRYPKIDLYRTLVAESKLRYKISIRKWRATMSGAAYELTFRDGRIKRLITAPRPRSPVSAAIFLHEVGHHAIGFHRYPSRCLEEYYVWQWAFREMTLRHIPIDERVLRHYERSMRHYVRMAQARGQTVPHDVRSSLQHSANRVRV